MLLLLELRRRPASKLKPLAEALALTQQAVSGYVGQLEDEGLVAKDAGLLRLTPKGEALLQGEVAGLKSFVDRAARELVRVETCVAIAGEPIAKGDKVFLFMIGGRLVATLRRKSPSWGIAQAGASAERDVVVGDLHGIVEIGDAKLTVLEVPGGKEGGSAAVDAEWLRRFASRAKGGRWAALDEVAEGVLADLGVRWHFEFAPFESGVAAVARGADLVYVGAPETVALLLAAIEAAKAEGRLGRFGYVVLRVPRNASRRSQTSAETTP